MQGFIQDFFFFFFFFFGGEGGDGGVVVGKTYQCYDEKV